jgi:hypothetical protein
LADYLYNPADFATVTLKIIGDPAWLQQGEASSTVNASNFSFAPFNSDGGINFDASEVCFDVIWNQPEDYNFSTGLTEVNNNQKNSNGTYTRNHPQQNQTYRALSCTSMFSKGSFTQTLKGTLLTTVPGQGPVSATAQSAAGSGRPATTPSLVGANNAGIRQPSADILASGMGLQRFDDGSTLQTFDDGSTLATGIDGSVSSTTVGPEAAGDPSPQPAAEPEDPTSNGDVSVADSLGPGEEIVSDNTSGAQIIAQDD